MTANRGIIEASTGTGLLGVHSLDTFSFSVPDLAQADAFHRSFGLTTRLRDGALELLTEGSDHVWGRIVEGAKKALSYLSFGIYEEDLERFKLHLKANGIRQVDPPMGLESNGLWVRDFEGTLVELKVASKSSPDEKSHGTMVSSAPGVAGAPKRSAGGLVIPSRMSHILLFTSDVDRAVSFYTRVFGLGLSDRAGSDIAFLHGKHGSDHHMVAFVRSTAPGIHHTSWDVPSVHQVGLGAMNMADRGYSEGWGLGRHVLGSNYFHYVRDPWGSYAEYSCDMDYIPRDIDWTAANHDGEDAFYIWGPKPPADFGVNHEAD